MATSKGVKVLLIGCVAALVIGAIVIIGGSIFVGKWTKSKLKKYENIAGTKDSDYGKRTEELQKKYPFTIPETNIVTEDQLKRFLEVRKQVFTVYHKYESEIKQMEKQPDKSDFGKAMKGLEMINELKTAQVSGLEQQRMSIEEYQYVVTSVYKSWFAQAAREGMKTESFTESSIKQLKVSIEEIDKQLANPDLPEEQKTQLRTVKVQLEKQLAEIPQNEDLKKLDEELKSVPPENIELFKRYEEEIKKYAMSGLEFFGF